MTKPNRRSGATVVMPFLEELPMKRKTPSVPCPIRGCRRKKRPVDVMCAQHWYTLPSELRDRVWSEYRRHPGSDEHRAAVAEAIRSVSVDCLA